MASFTAIVLALIPAVGHANTFLAAHPQVEMQSMPTQELEQLLLSELSSFDSDSRLPAAAAELRALYLCLPKNEVGKLDPAAVRYALHRHFARKFGWHLRGLAPGGGSWNASSPATIMKDKAPSYIMDVLEHRMHGQGMGLEELAVFAVTLEGLVRRETISNLDDIFAAMQISMSERVSETVMSKLVKNYFMTYINGLHNPWNSSVPFESLEEEMETEIIVWFDAKSWIQDLRFSLMHAESSRRNPFVSDYDFWHAAAVAHEVGHRFGTFQNAECKSLKDKLVDMEHGGSGRVTLSKFYSGIGSRDWPFIESVDYLRNLGALDESDPRRPSVVIANFLSSPSNCVAPSGFYSVCCDDECEGLLTQVEAVVKEPSVDVSQLVRVISNLASDTVAAPRNLSSVQVNRLGEIAGQHGGKVPLHGRLFAQWMHHAYPRECRFPHVAGSTNPLTQREFMDKFGVDIEATDDEIAQYIENASMPEPVAVVLPWEHAEELIASHRQVGKVEPRFALSKPVLILAFAAVVASGALPAWRVSKHLGLADFKQEKYLV